MGFPRNGFVVVLPEGAHESDASPQGSSSNEHLGLLFPQLCPTWHRHDAFNLMSIFLQTLSDMSECLRGRGWPGSLGQQVPSLDSPWAHLLAGAFSDAPVDKGFPLYNPCFSSCCPSQSVLPSWPFHWTMGALRKRTI